LKYIQNTNADNHTTPHTKNSTSLSARVAQLLLWRYFRAV